MQLSAILKLYGSSKPYTRRNHEFTATFAVKMFHSFGKSLRIHGPTITYTTEILDINRIRRNLRQFHLWHFKRTATISFYCLNAKHSCYKKK